jgi:hypothetical protein
LKALPGEDVNHPILKRNAVPLMCTGSERNIDNKANKDGTETQQKDAQQLE